jgi:hypothetical protein
MRIPFALIICICVFTACAFAEEASVALTIKPVPDDFFDKALDGKCPELEGKEDSVFIVGLFNPPTFSIKDLKNVALVAVDGAQLPLIVEKSSLYSEFEGAGINSLRFAFVISQSALSKGAPTLKWGGDVSATNNEVDKIVIYNGDKDRYRTFSWEERPKGGDGSYTATIEVIVDDYADIYYVWYLLPMAVIFALLFVKKAVLK